MGDSNPRGREPNTLSKSGDRRADRVGFVLAPGAPTGCVGPGQLRTTANETASETAAGEAGSPSHARDNRAQLVNSGFSLCDTPIPLVQSRAESWRSDGRFARVSEQDDAISDLRQGGVLSALAWAGWSCYRGVMSDYRPAAGHDQAWVGYTGHKLMLNRQDRVFSCEEFSVIDGNSNGGVDLLQEGISEIEFRAMPVIKPGSVVRANLNLSPGWKFQDWCWLLTSAPFGEARTIDWRKARPTKRGVASKPFHEGPDLFTILEELGEAKPTWRPDDQDGAERVLVTVHTVDLDSGQFEGFIGHPRLNSRKGEMAWHWLERLPDWGPDSPGRGKGRPFTPQGPLGATVDDAEVRLKDSVRKKDRP
jgi:hypothetical protein